jgi:hypothetical protein
LTKFGVRGPITEYVKALEGVRVDLPITGDRKSPQLNMASVNIKSILAKAAPNLLSAGAKTALNQFVGAPLSVLGVGKSSSSDRPPEEQRPSLEREAGKAIKGILGGKRSEEKRK